MHEKKIIMRVPLNLIEIDGDSRQALIRMDKAEQFYRKLTKALCEESPEVVYDF